LPGEKTKDSPGFILVALGKNHAVIVIAAKGNGFAGAGKGDTGNSADGGERAVS